MVQHFVINDIVDKIAWERWAIEQSVDFNTTTEQSAIDNKALVLEQEKNKTQEREFENQSQEQRSIGMTEMEKESPVEPVAQPDNTEPQKVEIEVGRQTKQDLTKLPEPQAPAEQKAVTDPKINKDYGW